MQNELSVISLVLNQNTGDDLNNAMHSIDGITHKVQRYHAQQPLGDMARLGELPDVVVLELDNENKESLDDIALFVEKNGEVTHVFVTVQDASVNLVRQLMRNGVRDVLAQPITALDITTALESTRARRRKVIAARPVHRGKVCAFLNTRGGAGSSFLALNVAHQLATEFNKTVCLVDMDIQFGTITVDLDLRADAGVLEALRNPSRIDRVFIDSLMVHHPSGLHFLPSPGDLSRTDDITADAVTRLINTLADSYDLLIISMPTNLNECSEQVLRMSEPVFLVTQNTLSMLRNLKILIERLPLRGILKAHLAVIHNRTDTVVHDPIFRKMKQVMDGVPLYRVRSDFKLAAQAATEGKTANELSTRAGIIKDIRVISSMLAENEAPDATQNRRSLFGWFS